MKISNLVNILLLVFFSNILGQIENLDSHTQMNLDCKKCHICDTPTKANPCLIVCPRNKIEIVRHSPSEGPENIIINEIKTEHDLYGPSHFTHRLHSEMSLMAGGCSICHHFNPPGKIVKCSSCHELKRERTDLTKPDLKAAYHRQCMGCHKSWEVETNCENCHKLNSNKTKEVTLSQIEKSHPKITIPLKLVYETKSEKGNFVTFYHNEHNIKFGNECRDCHDQESCATCHTEFKLESIMDDVHDRCSNCHDTENSCNKCHNKKITEPFNHKNKTGFSLNNYHSKLSCISCHKSKNNFSGLKKDCTHCHTDKDGYFDHGITKILLDENHIDSDCEDCHTNNNYKLQPVCNGCHDEDINYPASIPGSRINK